MLHESMWFELWAGVALKSTVLLGVAWLITFALRRRSAAVRHLVWSAAAIAVLALPFFSVSLPALAVPSIGTLAPGAATLFETTAAERSSQPASLVPARTGSSRPHGPLQTPLDWRLVLMSLWAAGVAALVIQMLIAFVTMSRMRRTARPSPDRMLAKQLAEELGISYPAEVLEIPEGSMPMTCGIPRPAIFMPRDSAGWTEDRRRMVLLHELAHVRRRDAATHLVARLALVLNWWNPLAWIAWREFLKEGERATDDLVLHSGARASDYAGHLLEVARSMQSPPALAWAAVAMARRSELEGRLVAILDPRLDRKTPGRASALVASLVAIAMAAPFAALHAQDQAVLSDIDATIRAATAQHNYEMLEKPATAFEALRQYDNAKKLLDAAVAIRGDVAGKQSVEYGVGLMKLADLEDKRNQAKSAEALYAKSVQVIGNQREAAPALIYLGVIKIIDTDYQKAFEYFQSAESLDSSQAGRARMWMAVVREREQNPAEAETLYRSALAVEDGKSNDAKTTMALYARFLKDQGRVEDPHAIPSMPSDRLMVKSDALRVRDADAPPKVIQKKDPEYSAEARAAKYQGTTVLFVEIGPDGLAHNIQITRAIGFGLDENAIAAVSQWKFQPATKAGAAVTVQATIEVNFRLL